MMERGRFYFLAFSVAMLFIVCCSKVSEKQITSPKAKDDFQIPQNVFSLTPSINEILYALIDTERIIARTPYDSFPVEILKKPVINNFPPDFEKILSFSPDLILAKEGMIGKEDLDRLIQLKLPVLVQRYESLEDIYHNVLDLGVKLNCQQKADSLVDSLKNQIQAIQEKTIDRSKPSILIIISLEPLYVFGNNSYVNDLIKAAGGKNAMLETMSSPYPMINREYLLKLNPEIIIGTDISKLLQYYPEMKLSKAVKYKKVYPIDTEILSRPGPRVVEGIARINELIYAGNQ